MTGGKDLGKHSWGRLNARINSRLVKFPGIRSDIGVTEADF